MAVSTGNLTLYKDPPLELREIVLSQCTPSTLASLSCTAKAVRDEAEPMLYDTISLHDSRWRELLLCVLTLLSSPGKARLVRTFSLTVAKIEESSLPLAKRHLQFANLVPYLERALRNMSSLKILSVWAPHGYDVTNIELAVRRADFKLSRLYLSGLKDFLGLMHHQPHLEAIGLWNKSAYCLCIHKEDIPLFRQLTLYKPGLPTTAANVSVPVIFGVLHRDEPGVLPPRQRDLTFFNYPWKQDECESDDNHTGVQNSTASRFWHVETRNSVVYRTLRRDLRQDWQPVEYDRDSPEDKLNLILPDFSRDSIMKARRVFELYWTADFCYDPTVDLRLCVVDTFKYPFDMLSISSALGELFCGGRRPFTEIYSVVIDFDAWTTSDTVLSSLPDASKYWMAAEDILAAAAEAGATSGMFPMHEMHFQSHFFEVDYDRSRNEKLEVTWRFLY